MTRNLVIVGVRGIYMTNKLKKTVGLVWAVKAVGAILMIIVIIIGAGLQPF